MRNWDRKKSPPGQNYRAETIYQEMKKVELSAGNIKIIIIICQALILIVATAQGVLLHPQLISKTFRTRLTKQCGAPPHPLPQRCGRGLHGRRGVEGVQDCWNRSNAVKLVKTGRGHIVKICLKTSSLLFYHNQRTLCKELLPSRRQQASLFKRVNAGDILQLGFCNQRKIIRAVARQNESISQSAQKATTTAQLSKLGRPKVPFETN